jgi:predicted dehydrogenase
MWQIGIIGAGSYGEQHAKSIAALDKGKVVAASRTNVQALAEFTAQYGGTGYANYRTLLEDPAVNVVVIATPHHLHTDIAIAAARAGKHILLEKPMAPTLAECHQIARAADEHGVQLMLGHVNHFAQAYQVAKTVLDSGEMGQVVLGTATMQKYWMESNRRDWHLDRSTGGGVWMTVGVHPLDRLVWLTGQSVTSVSAQFSTTFYPQQADDTGMAFLRFDQGAAATIVSVGYNDGAPKHLTELVCSKGMLTIDYNEGVKIGRGERWQTVPESVPTGDWMAEALTEEWRGFLAALDSGAKPPVDAEYALHIMEVLFAAEESSRTQHEIAITSTWPRG